MSSWFSNIYRCLCILFLSWASSLAAHSIVYIHIGPDLPPYLADTIAQARLFNKECPIYLIANQKAIQTAPPEFEGHNISFVSCESLPRSDEHNQFHGNALHAWTAGGFWVYTSERFFYLEELINHYNLSDVFHFENDIMLYIDLCELVPIFQKHYAGMIGATFENDDRCVPGMLFVSTLQPITMLIQNLPQIIDGDNTDMASLARFKNEYRGTYIDYLPIIMPDYASDYPLKAFGKISKNPKLFSNHFDEFDSVFDAAALGVFLGGWDSRYHSKEAAQPGTLDFYSVFSPSHFLIRWKKDDELRSVPFINYKGKEIRINNLHITNKVKIPFFSSLNAFDDLFYVLRNRKDADMFSMFGDVLSALHSYEKGVVQGVKIDFAAEGECYDRQCGPNWWNYYCQSICVGQGDLIIDSHCESHTKPDLGLSPTVFYNNREEAFLLIQKYIHLQTHILEKIEKFKNQFFQKHFVIGVHYSQQNSLSYESYLRQINEVIDSQKISDFKIFVVTDDLKFIDLLHDSFGDRVVYQKGPLGPVEDSKFPDVKSPPKPYLVGERAMIDCLLLANSSFMVLTDSSLSLWASLFNPYIPIKDMTGKLPIPTVSRNSNSDR